jgi:hypothetical protein
VNVGEPLCGERGGAPPPKKKPVSGAYGNPFPQNRDTRTYSMMSSDVRLPFASRLLQHAQSLLAQGRLDEALDFCKAEIDKLREGRIDSAELIRFNHPKVTSTTPTSATTVASRIQWVMLPIRVDYAHILSHDVQPLLKRLFAQHVDVECDHRTLWLATHP